MIAIGNFFFKYRNFLFIFLYLLLFAPSPSLFTAEAFGENYYVYPLLIGLFVTISGELIRGITIGLAYIIRGGKDKKVYAEKLVTEGIFNHGRNPLYVGNILMLAGVGILSNSLLYVLVVIPGFLFIYQAIVLAEENFLRGKFGKDFDNYTQRVNRWIIDFRGIGQSVQAMKFNYKRWILKEYNTLLVWLVGISAIICLRYPELFEGDDHRQRVFITSVIVFGSLYLIVRYLKKSGKMTA
ncbi:protein-S-isoprenylcysteine O-methyltransferase Ste14 [Dyadobacter jejuensis]|uniref:Protein-S-isoprenylcysteine O-methyltransferase Ste14 n=1 Tax=Dyadobacter jejuensis TaxID=1082580 RepID=A0A316AA37_9BACT|nr:isoprenylcysteine carboxylmethyltransferase family protein [Dyadobacter jejuensis]PWJ54269.1 protein-S-isoprenylcysteine O-methyltransferase Ste14 [Dyadobacter jejuensis]